MHKPHVWLQFVLSYQCNNAYFPDERIFLCSSHNRSILAPAKTDATIFSSCLIRCGNDEGTGTYQMHKEDFCAPVLFGQSHCVEYDVVAQALYPANELHILFLFIFRTVSWLERLMPWRSRLIRCGRTTGRWLRPSVLTQSTSQRS